MSWPRADLFRHVSFGAKAPYLLVFVYPKQTDEPPQGVLKLTYR